MKSPTNPFKRVQKPFIAVNILLTCIAIASFVILVVLPDRSTQLSFAQAASIVMAIVAIGVAVAIMFFGYSLVRFLQKAQGAVSSTAKPNPAIVMMWRGALVFCICYIGESATWIYTSIDLESFYNSQEIVVPIFYGFNIAALLMLLALFKNGVDQRNPNKRP